MANKNVTKKMLAEKDAEIKKNMEILGISREEADEPSLPIINKARVSKTIINQQKRR